MTDPRLLASRQDSKKVADGFLVADSKLHLLGGNARPHFSVTGELWKTEGAYRRGNESGLLTCGAIHDEILAGFPELAPVVAVHLADDDGVPMHAVANGWYFYSGAAEAYERAYPKWHDPEKILPPKVRAASALRVEPDEIPDGLHKDEFEAFAEALRPRWLADAAKALAVLKEET